MNTTMRNKNQAFCNRILPAPVGKGFRMNGYWVWGGSVAKDKSGKYHMFASRWSKKLSMFKGYMVSSEIVRAVSDTPEGPYEFVETILPTKQDSARWDGRMAHNPSIHKYGDKYLLYYIGSTYDGPCPVTEPMKDEEDRKSYDNIRIGVAFSEFLSGPWKTMDHPILDVRPDKWDCRVVTNPAVCIREDGKILLYYRSNTADGIGLAIADHWKGPYNRVSDFPALIVEDDKKIEDPYVWWNGEHYEMLVKDISAKITGELKAGAHFVSQDGINWKASENPKAYSRNVLWDDGTTTVQGCMERPQLLFDEQGQATHLFVATGDGPGDFRHAINTWNMVLPLKTYKVEQTVIM